MRPGVANWLHDSVGRAKQARAIHEALYPGRGVEIITGTDGRLRYSIP